MTQSTGSLAGFFGGGGKAAKFPVKGSTVTGEVTAVHPPEPQTDFETRQPVPGKTQVRVELKTEERNPEIEFDDGSRTLYVRGWMQGAIGEALRKAGVTEPQIGGELSVTYSEDGPPTRPGLQGPKKYTAVYRPPAPSAAQHLTQHRPTPQSQNAPIPADPPPGIDPKAWAAMPTDAKQAIANTMTNDPPF